jgi:type II secretory ATPase GspE/PulE/Tfp pilus assembly ATPase PilB-like protein
MFTHRPMIALFVRKLSLLVGTGVPLVEAIDVIALGFEGPGMPGAAGPAGPMREALAVIARDLRRGARLAQALEAHPDLFPPDLVAIVRSGEARGALEAALLKIAQGLDEGTIALGPHRAMHGPPGSGAPPHGPHPPPHGPPGWGPPHPPPWAPPPPAWAWAGGPGAGASASHGDHTVHVRSATHIRHQEGQAASEASGDAAPPGGNAGPGVDPDVAARQHALEVVRIALAAGASDVHADPTAGGGGRVRFRVDGQLREHRRLEPPAYAELLASLKILGGLDVGERRAPQDAKVLLDTGGQKLWARLATAPYVHGEAATLRLLPSPAALPTLDEHGFTEENARAIRRWVARPYGLIAVTGPTGCGKTTLLYSLLSAYDARASKVVTVEQPVEHELPDVNQLSLAPELGLTWATALRAQMRQDPDVIMVGEVQTPEIAEIVLRIALSGHVALTCAHAETTAGLFARLALLGINPGLLGEALTGAVAQRLVRRLCLRCREPMPEPARERSEPPSGMERERSERPSGTERERSERPSGTGPASPGLPAGCQTGADLPPGTYFRARGCPDCSGTGYRGRLAIHELVEPVPAVIDAIVRAPGSRELAAAIAGAGFRPLVADGFQKAAQGITTIDEVLRACGA